jgi:hypothetical protein
MASISPVTSLDGASPKVKANLLKVGGLGAPKLAEARRSVSRSVLHCTLSIVLALRNRLFFSKKLRFKIWHQDSSLITSLMSSLHFKD